MRFLLIIASLALVACTPPSGQVEIVGMTMGTQFTVKLPNGVGDRDPVRLQKQIEGSLEDVERMMSTYLYDSEISLFNANESTDWQPVSKAFCDSIAETLDISAMTDGAFDITVGPLVNLWGFGPGDFVESPPADEQVAALLERMGYEYLQTDCDRPAIRKTIPGLVVDLSAYGKGYAVDRLGELLDAQGFDSFLAEVGGEMRLRGVNAQGQAWAVGIEVPLPNQRKPHTVLRLSDTTVATSGDYRNFFEYKGEIYSHTIDTRTGRPVTHSLASVTVVDGSGARADALATALLVLGPDEGLALAKKEGLAVLFLLRDDGAVRELATPAFENLRTS